MDDHNLLRQPPRPNLWPIDEETIPLRHHLNPLDEERACQFIHNRPTLQGRHKSLYRWSTDNPLINISGKHYKCPIQASINSPPQRLGERSKYIYRYQTPAKVRTEKPISYTSIFWNSFSHSIHSNFSIGGFVAGTTPVTHISSSFHSFFRVELAEDDSNQDD